MDQCDFKEGDMIDFARRPNSKTEPKWRGPAEVITTHNGGALKLLWQGRVLTCAATMVRRTVSMVHTDADIYEMNVNPGQWASQDLRDEFRRYQMRVELIGAGQHVLHGRMTQDRKGTWKIAKATKKEPHPWNMIQTVVRLYVRGCEVRRSERGAALDADHCTL